jgi:hypothetical protein
LNFFTHASMSLLSSTSAATMVQLRQSWRIAL